MGPLNGERRGHVADSSLGAVVRSGESNAVSLIGRKDWSLE